MSNNNGNSGEMLKYVLAILIVVTILAGIIYFAADKMMDKGLAKADQYAEQYGQAMAKKEMADKAFGSVNELINSGMSSMGRR
jgi:uncharacterized protein YneF (UPF0154 family)